MSFYPSNGYQSTADTWHRMSKPEYSLEKDNTSVHIYWDICQGQHLQHAQPTNFKSSLNGLI